MKEKRKLYQRWWFWLITTLIVIIIIAIVSITILKNKLTAEETVSKFMYLIENKEYEEAKKLCNNDLEKLDILSNLKPSNLTFEFSKDNKNATTTLLEQEIEVTKLNVKLENTILGWKIQNYEVVTDLINPQEIEDRLKSGKNVTDIQLLYWGESDVANKDEIAQYIENNTIVAMIFAETMKAQHYTKAEELYKPITEKELTIEKLKEYDWENYEIVSNFEIINNLNGITIKLGEKEIYIYIANGKITGIMKANM